MKLTRVAALAAVLLSAAAALPAQAGVFYISDFDANNPGFTSDYTPVAPAPNAGIPEGVEIITNNPNSVHPSWASFTNGTGNALIVNGSTGSVPNLVFASSVINVTTAGSYQGKASVANICCNTSFLSNPSAASSLDFFFNINGTENLAGTFTTLPGPVGGAYPFAGTFFDVFFNTDLAAGDTFQFIVRNKINAASGNDFALDNIVIQTTPVPEPLTLSVFGAGLVGAAALRRKKAKKA